MPTGRKPQLDKKTLTRVTRNRFMLNITGCMPGDADAECMPAQKCAAV